MEEKSLFAPEIVEALSLDDWPSASIHPNTIGDIGKTLLIRPLKNTDYYKGFPDILSQMTEVGNVSKEQFLETFEKMRSTEGVYYVIVIEDSQISKIIGSATLVVEQKFIHGCAKRARIEDVVVHEAYRGRQLGKVLIATTSALAKKLNCYKGSLDCRDSMVGFYSTLGYSRDEGNSNFMIHRF